MTVRKHSPRAWVRAGVLALSLAGMGCVVAAAGAGAGGGIYFTQRGVESVVPAPVDRVAGATRRAFDQLKIATTKSAAEQGDDGEKREMDGTAGEREVSVTLKAEGGHTRVQVVARKSAVTWDKDFARAVLDKIVALSR
jgi:hypothetical protein